MSVGGEERAGIYRELDQVRADIATTNGLTADMQVQVAVNTSKLVTIEENYISKEEFAPVKRIVWGFVGVILTGVALAVLALILNKPPTPPLH